MPLGLFAVRQVARSRTFQVSGTLVNHVETDAPVIALTFDDGPTAAHTGEVLGVLADRQVQATFFVVGEALERNPWLGAQIVAAGHELGNHSYSHAPLVGRSTAFIRAEIERTDRLIRQAGYQGEIHFRPPNGKKLIALPWTLAATGRTTIMWSLEPEAAGSADDIVARVLADARPGSIVLLHLMYESRAESRAALPAIIDGLQAQGYRLVTVSELLRE